MDLVIADRWTTALKSREFSQGGGRLFNGTDYCCLGVLCELYRRETGKGSWSDPADGYVGFIYDASSDGNACFKDDLLPAPVRAWAGLRDDGPFIYDEGDANTKLELAVLNDDGKSFEELADIIEKYKDEL